VTTNRGKKKERVQRLIVKTPAVEKVLFLLHGGRERQRLTDTVINGKKE
jgi:hypothetical protein